MPKIRPASAADAACLATFAERAFRDTYAEFNSVADMEVHVRAHLCEPQFRRHLQDPEQRFVVAMEGSEMAGFAQLQRGPAPPAVGGTVRVGILRFYVDAPWHGRGLAPRLMEAALATAADLGADVAWLGVWERNPRAIAFYKKCGFRTVGRASFRLGSDVQQDHLMQRSIETATARVAGS